MYFITIPTFGCVHAFPVSYILSRRTFVRISLLIVMHDQKPKRRAPSYGGRSGVPEKSQRSRSMSFSPDRVRRRGRSPAFSALAANFENPNARNLSTPPPAVAKLYPKSVTEPAHVHRSATIAALTASFEPILNKGLYWHTNVLMAC